MKIDINNQSGIEVDKKFVRASAMAALKMEKIKDKEVSIAFVKKDEIRKLNKWHRKLDKATDVLSFEGDKSSNFLGEIIISPEVVKQRLGDYFEKSLAHVIIHGVLHLAGYDHAKVRDRVIMREREEKILQSIVK